MFSKLLKILFISLIFLSTNFLTAKCDLPANTSVQPAVPPLATYDDCVKKYLVSSENLFYICLSAINSANYQIQEIQYKSGTITFKAYSKEFIVIIARIDYKTSLIKILPSDSTYNFTTGLVQKVFSYIDVNQKTEVQSVM